MVKAQVMQTTGCFHDHIIKTSTDVAKDITHAVVDLDPTDAMLNAYALAGNDCIVGLLLHRQFTAFGLLLGLKGLDLIRFVALKTGVFPELAAGWKAQALFIGQLRIVLLACPGRTENLDLTRAFVTDDVILDRVPFLLATGVPLLLIGILRDRLRTTRESPKKCRGNAVGISTVLRRMISLKRFRPYMHLLNRKKIHRELLLSPSMS